MKFKKLAEVYSKLEGTTKRLEKIDILSDFLKKLSNEDKDVLYLLLGRIYPEYDERRIGISDKLVIKALEKSLGTSKDKIIKKWKEIGDLGKVAEEFTKKKSQSTLMTKQLDVQKVINNLRKLPGLEGIGTINRKISLISELMTSASPLESLYLSRILIGDLRIGVQESTIREAIVKTFFSNEDKKKASDEVQRAIDRSNDIAKVFEISSEKNLKKLDEIHLEVGKPIKAMLAQKTENIKSAFKEIGEPAAVEYKYDGFRLIIHKNKENVKLFTRKLENVTKQFPEVVDYLKKYVKGESFILDSEAVGYDKKTKEYKPFQEISQRIRRKYHIEKLQKELPIEINVFDILYYNGKSVMKKPFSERSKIIRKIIKKTPYKIIPSRQIITSDEKKAKEFYKRALDDNQEGVMFKNLNAVYKPGRRVGTMLKIKPEERDLDLVITGAEYGTGKRKGWMSSFILSCRGNKKGEYLEIGKMGTGILEKQTDKSKGITFEELTKKLEPLIIKEKGKNVEIKPKLVVSITYQEIQHSPNYSSGFALRFPRFTAIRDDKPLSEVADLKEVQKDFENQKRNWRYG